MPTEFIEAKNEPAFSMDSISFCFWRLRSEKTWSIGDISFPPADDPDGSEFLLQCLDGKPERYQEYAEECFELEVPIPSIEHIYKHLPLTQELVNKINPEVSLSELQEELNEIGYPSICNT